MERKSTETHKKGSDAICMISMDEIFNSIDFCVRKSILEDMMPVKNIELCAKNLNDFETGVISSSAPFRAVITEVFNPYRFYFNFARDKDDPFEEMMAAMNSFYTMTHKEIEIFTMRPNHIQQGHACVVYSDADDQWYRAAISSSVRTKDRTVKVFYVDSGKVKLEDPTNLRYLIREFSTYPKQAARGRLALVAPPDGGSIWRLSKDFDATKCLIDLCDEKILLAETYALEEADKVFHLVLHKTYRGEKVLNINQALASRGFAKIFQPGEDIFPQLEDQIITFEMMETSQVPPYETLSEHFSIEWFLRLWETHHNLKLQEKERKFYSSSFFVPPPEYSSLFGNIAETSTEAISSTMEAKPSGATQSTTTNESKEQRPDKPKSILKPSKESCFLILATIREVLKSQEAEK